MDIDSVCGSNPDQFADDQLLWNDMLADSNENRVDDGRDLLGVPSILDNHLEYLVWLHTATTSSDCWSAASEAPLTLNCGGPGGASEAVSLTGEGSTRSGHDHLQQLQNPEIIQQLSSCEIHLLPPQAESGGGGEDDVISLESDEDEVQSESTVNFQVPEIGMKFPSEEEAYKFYSSYARKLGFIVRKGKVQRLSNGAIRKKFFFCSREGFKCKKETTTPASKYQRKETRTGCEAMVKLTIEKNGDWVISQFNPDHNHELEGSSMSKLLLIAASNPTIASEEAEAEPGAANCVQGVDGQSLIDCFRHIQLEDPLFLYTVQVTDKNFLSNFFWTGGRSRTDYDCFGDILIFDTSLIDANNMTFATFLGINHHRKCVLFGGALLLDTSIPSYVWLFRTFMEVMCSRSPPPKTIFTDWCPATEAAIELVLPGTQHLLGTWYILQNATKRLPGKSGFDRLFEKCIFDSESEEEFESMWGSLLDQFELHDNLWLKSLHERRRKWAQFCCESTFSADLRSIQGRESISNFLHEYPTSGIKSTPSDYVLHYLKLVENQRREELEEDFRGKESAPAVVLRSSTMEKQAANVYTCTIFRLFQEELLECLSLGIEEISTNTFKLTEESGTKQRIVEFNSLDSSVKCSCKKYESVGILCVHALKVLNAKNIFRIPPGYILKRWTKLAKDVPEKGGRGAAAVAAANAMSSRIDEEEVSNGTPKNQLKRKHEGSRRAISHSNCMDENSQLQSVFRSSRPPLPSQFLHHSKSSISVQECWKERAMRAMGTERRTIMVRMEEMEKEISRLRNEHQKIVTSFNKPERTGTTTSDI